MNYRGWGARHIFAPGIYWDRRRPGGLPLQATMVLVADAVGATVCRRDGGGPSRDGQQASHRENVARTLGVGARPAIVMMSAAGLALKAIPFK